MGDPATSDAVGREVLARADGLRRALRGQGLDGALLLFPTDVFYCSGTRQNGALWIPAEGAPVFLVRRSLARARLESRVADVRPFPPARELAGLFEGRCEIAPQTSQRQPLVPEPIPFLALDQRCQSLGPVETGGGGGELAQLGLQHGQLTSDVQVLEVLFGLD